MKSQRVIVGASMLALLIAAVGCGGVTQFQGAQSIAVVGQAPPPPPPPRVPSGDRDANVIERARRWLAVRDPAIEGSGGDRHTFATTVAIVRGFDLDPNDAYALLAEWNLRCKPPWTERDLRRKVREADERSKAERGFLRDARRAS